MLPVEIDFDEASREWRKNKIYLGCGDFRYCCSEPTKKREKCKNRIVKDNLCHVHLKMTKKKHYRPMKSKSL